jgi:hypothetical protein
MRYRYTLDPTPRKHICPACGKKTFVRYTDTERREYLPAEFGRCDREIQCGYHLNPYKAGYGKDKDATLAPPPRRTPATTPPPPAKRASLPANLVAQALAKQGECNFGLWLAGLIGKAQAAALLAKYRVGYSDHWQGATVFFQVDTSGRFRAGKVMQYNSTTGKRVKEPPRISWLHSVHKLENYELRQTLFGAHLLHQRPTAPVGIVESEKTAILAAAALPKYVWLASGGLSNLKPDRCKELAGRAVFLFPDLSAAKEGTATAFDKWQAVGAELARVLGCKVRTTDLLERVARPEQRAAGFDLADFLLSELRKAKPAPPAKELPPPPALPAFVPIATSYQPSVLSDYTPAEIAALSFADWVLTWEVETLLAAKAEQKPPTTAEPIFSLLPMQPPEFEELKEPAFSLI